MNTISQDTDLYFYVENGKQRREREQSERYSAGEPRKHDIGPKTTVSKWHNNSEPFKRRATPTRYSDAFKKRVIDESVLNNMSLTEASIKYKISYETLKHWFCVHKVRARKRALMRKRVLNLASKGLNNSEISKQLGISVGTVYRHKRGS